VIGTLTNLTRGRVLSVEVGQHPDTTTTRGGTQLPASFNGGGAPGYANAAGGGGSASDVRTVPSANSSSLASRLIVAGGGHSENYGVTVPPADAGQDAQGWRRVLASRRRRTSCR
jgi:hypothetical protein